MENFRLRVFRTVAAHRSFRRAAEELRLTQPAVSSQVRALEEELGVPLFDRSGSRVTLTAAGDALLPYAEQLRGLAEQARGAVGAVAGQTAGTVAIGASQTISQYLLPSAVAAFLREHPAVHLRLSGGNTQHVLTELRAHRIDLGLIEGPAEARDLRVQPYMEDHLLCVVPPGHPWADREVEPDELRRAVLLTRESGSGANRILERALADAGVPMEELTLGLRFSSTEALLSAVEAGLGIAFVSRWAVRRALALGTLRPAHLRGLSLRRAFSAVWLAGPEPGGAAGAFLRFLLHHAEAVVPSLRGSTGKGKGAKALDLRDGR